MKSMLKSLMSVAAAALALTSCSTDATDEAISKGGSKTLVVNASIDQTRTTMADNHIDLKWSENDVILFYIGETATTFNKINPLTGGTITGVTYENGNTVYANYSLDNEKYSKEGVTKAEIKIDHEQEQSKANVFAGENLPMIAKGEIIDGKVDLAFKPFGCVLVFNVYGPVENETIKSIKFDPGVPCCGYQNCDLTIGASDYVGLSYRTSATVTLTTPAAIGTAKPEDTKKGENQVYLVVAPFNYTAATITVTTGAGKTYTFKSAKGIDCSRYSARVVNLNLTKSDEMQPAIEVPPVSEQPADANGELLIEGINFLNIDELDPANEVGVYSAADLANPLTGSWLTITNNAELFTNGKLYCSIAANEDTTPRTAYIGIKCAGAQAAIAITQVGKGSTPAAPDPTVAAISGICSSNTYGEQYNDTWIVTWGSSNGAFGCNDSKNVSKCNLAKYPEVAEALGIATDTQAVAVISKKALPAGYNTATLEYSRVRAATKVGIAFSADGVKWIKIMDFVDLARTSTTVTGLQTYSFTQQAAGYYAFVATANAGDSRIQGSTITFSQSKQ